MWSVPYYPLATERQAAYVEWLGQVISDPVKRGRVQVVGALAADVLDWLAAREILPATAEISLNDAVVIGAKARRHVVQGNALSASEWAKLPAMLAEPGQVLFDTRSGHLIYVAAAGDSRQAKLAVEFDYLLKKGKGETNLIVSAFKTPPESIDGEIKGGFFEVVK